MVGWKEELDMKYDREMKSGNKDKMDRANRIILTAISQLDRCTNVIKIKMSEGVIDEVNGLPEGYQYEIVECDKYGEPLEPENVPCEKCGRSDLPLHINMQCPECCPEGP